MDYNIIKNINIYTFRDNNIREILTQYEHGIPAFCFTVFHDSNAIDLTEFDEIAYYATKNDGYIIANSCDVKNNEIILTVTPQMTACAGLVRGILELSKDGNTFRCYGINFEVKDSPNDVQIVSSDEMTILNKKIEDVEQIISEANIFLESSQYIYFKKNCPDWSEPRIYFFNTESLNDGSGMNEAWEWQYSPYMTPNREGYYYFPIVRGFDNVIFFCDETDASGFNYKTDNLLIPTSSWCNTPLFYQSDIGANGFWADYMTKTAKLIVQHNVHSASVNASGGTKIKDVECVTGKESIHSNVYDMGLIENTLLAIRNHYEYVEFPVDCEELHFTFNEIDVYSENKDILFSRECKIKVQEVCYVYPVVYLHDVLFCEDFSVQGYVDYFNAYDDFSLFERLDTNRSLLRLKTQVDALDKTSITHTQYLNQLFSATYRENGSFEYSFKFEGEKENIKFNYMRVGDLLLIECHDQITYELVTEKLYPKISINLPYVIELLGAGYAGQSLGTGHLSYEFTEEFTHVKAEVKMYSTSTSSLYLVFEPLADIGSLDPWDYHVYFNLQIWCKIKL